MCIVFTEVKINKILQLGLSSLAVHLFVEDVLLGSQPQKISLCYVIACSAWLEKVVVE